MEQIVNLKGVRAMLLPQNVNKEDTNDAQCHTRLKGEGGGAGDLVH